MGEWLAPELPNCEQCGAAMLAGWIEVLGLCPECTGYLIEEDDYGV